LKNEAVVAGIVHLQFIEVQRLFCFMRLEFFMLTLAERW